MPAPVTRHMPCGCRYAPLTIRAICCFRFFRVTPPRLSDTPHAPLPILRLAMLPIRAIFMPPCRLIFATLMPLRAMILRARCRKNARTPMLAIFMPSRRHAIFLLTLLPPLAAAHAICAFALFSVFACASMPLFRYAALRYADDIDDTRLRQPLYFYAIECRHADFMPPCCRAQLQSARYMRAAMRDAMFYELRQACASAHKRCSARRAQRACRMLMLLAFRLFAATPRLRVAAMARRALCAFM